jgi:hypothetical protein
MNLNLSREPFSAFGSWLSVAHQSPRKYVTCQFGEGIYLRTHHGKGIQPNEIFKLEVLRNGEVTDAECEADASEFRFISDGRSIGVVFDNKGNLRFQGEGLGLRFRARGWVAYSEGTGRFTVNATTYERRYQFDCRKGRLCWDAPWTGKRCERVVVDLLPEEQDGTWECALEEFSSTWVMPRQRESYGALHSRSKAVFDTFCSQHGAGPDDPELQDTWIRSLYVNWSACVKPEGLITRTGMLMSKHWMDRIWSWDHCFNAQALIHGDEGLAWDQLLILFDHQDEFGAIPDSITDTIRTYNFCKPPVHGWTVRYLLSQARQRPENAFLEKLYAQLCKHTDWFLTHRKRKDMALPYYLHGNDSGWDNSTMFAEGVPLVAPDLAALLVLQTEVLSELASELGRSEESVKWSKTSAELLEGLMELWNGRSFVPHRLNGGEAPVPVACESLIPCIPILLGKRLPAEVRGKVASDIEAFVTDYGVATEKPQSGRYEADGYWRGPVWAPSTVLIAAGLKESGFPDLAATIARNFCSACRQSGFAENFNALTGDGLRDRAYTWTSSGFQLLVRWFGL